MKNFVQKYGKWALVTGASSGIGRECARKLAAGDMNIVLVARDKERLEATSRELCDEFSIKTRVIAQDLSDPQVVERIAELVSDLEIGVLVPAAGIEINGPFLETDPLRQQQMINLNILAPTLMSHHYGKLMASRGKGAILLISSLFGYQGIPMFSSYAASKSYILLLGEALNVELKPQGIDVTVLSPGLTLTAMTANIPIKWSRMPMIPMQAEKVAKIGLQSLGRKSSVVPGLMNKIYAWQNRLLPRMAPTKLFGFIISRAMRAASIKNH